MFTQLQSVDPDLSPTFMERVQTAWYQQMVHLRRNGTACSVTHAVQSPGPSEGHGENLFFI